MNKKQKIVNVIVVVAIILDTVTAVPLSELKPLLAPEIYVRWVIYSIISGIAWDILLCTTVWLTEVEDRKKQIAIIMLIGMIFNGLRLLKLM